MANFFPVNEMVEYDLQLNYANTLATAARATPDNFFNNNPMDGVSKTIPYPIQYKALQGQLTYNASTEIQSSVKRTATLALDMKAVLPISFTGQEITFESGAPSIDSFFKMYVKKLVVALGNTQARQVMQKCIAGWTDTIGDPTQPLNGLTTMAAIQAQFANMGLSMSATRKYFGMSPSAAASLQIPYATYYNEDVNYPILKGDTNRLGVYSGIECYMDQTVTTHQNGTFAASGNVTVSANVTSGNINDPYTTISLAGFTNSAAGVLLAGDRISFENATTSSNKVFPVNPQMPLSATGIANYAPYGTAGKTFTVVEDVTASGTGTASVKVFPPVISSSTDPYQNVSRQIVSGDKVVLFGGASGRYVMNVCWVPEALRFANPIIATYPVGAAGDNMGLGGLVYQKPYSEKVEGTDLQLSYLLAAQGSDPNFLTTISGRSFAGAVAFQGYGFVVASSV